MSTFVIFSEKEASFHSISTVIEEAIAMGYGLLKNVNRRINILRHGSYSSLAFFLCQPIIKGYVERGTNIRKCFTHSIASHASLRASLHASLLVSLLKFFIYSMRHTCSSILQLLVSITVYLFKIMVLLTYRSECFCGLTIRQGPDKPFSGSLFLA